MTVRPGCVTTYGDLAKACGTSPRAVGQVLKRNPFAPVVPCHRVVRNDGTIGGFMGKTAGNTIREKIRRLGAEGVRVREGKIENFPTLRFTFS